MISTSFLKASNARRVSFCFLGILTATSIERQMPLYTAPNTPFPSSDTSCTSSGWMVDGPVNPRVGSIVTAATSSRYLDLSHLTLSTNRTTKGLERVSLTLARVCGTRGGERPRWLMQQQRSNETNEAFCFTIVLNHPPMLAYPHLRHLKLARISPPFGSCSLDISLAPACEIEIELRYCTRCERENSKLWSSLAHERMVHGCRCGEASEAEVRVRPMPTWCVWLPGLVEHTPNDSGTRSRREYAALDRGYGAIDLRSVVEAGLWRHLSVSSGCCSDPAGDRSIDLSKLAELPEPERKRERGLLSLSHCSRASLAAASPSASRVGVLSPSPRLSVAVDSLSHGFTTRS